MGSRWPQRASRWLYDGLERSQQDPAAVSGGLNMATRSPKTSVSGQMSHNSVVRHLALVLLHESIFAGNPEDPRIWRKNAPKLP